jgi:hypothetical protein
MLIIYSQTKVVINYIIHPYYSCRGDSSRNRKAAASDEFHHVQYTAPSYLKRQYEWFEENNNCVVPKVSCKLLLDVHHVLELRTLFPYHQWRTQEIFLGVEGGSTSSVEDRRQRERESWLMCQGTLKIVWR